MNLRRIGIVAFGCAIVAGTGIALAWTGPTGSPPSNNVSAPVNVGSTYQEKSGSMWVDGGIGVNTGSAICLGTAAADCITSWAQAGSQNGVGGSGTSPYVPVFTAASTLGNSSLSSNGQSSTENGNFYVDGILNVQQSANNWAANIEGSNYGLEVESGGTSWAGKFTGGGAYGMYVTNANGSYAEIADGNWAVAASSSSGIYGDIAGPTWAFSGNGPTYTSSYSRADGGFCIGSSCITSWTQAGSSGVGGSGTSPDIPVFTNGTTLGNSSIASNSLSSTENGNFIVTGTLTTPTITGITGGVSIGTANTGWYSDANNLAARYPGSSGDFFIQSAAPGATTYVEAGAGIGGTEVFGTLAVTSTVTASAFLYASDERLKTDIQPLTGNLAKILQLQPVSYLWKNPAMGTGEQIGFIAQQVQPIVPQVVHVDASTTLESIDYARIMPLVVGAEQDLNAKIEAQQQQLDEQQQEIDQLEAQVAALQNK